ncbi:MAG: DUF4956 domain-containing protein [Pirellulaceae bacterium]|nr:DUF4956 domain-containing protein [Pirellulaceae bacterium]
MSQLFQSFIHGDPGLSLSPMSTALTLLLSFLLGQTIGWIYMWTHDAFTYSKSFVGSLVVLPVIVSVLMILMAGNLAVAFGLLAVFAVVRFRNVLKDTRDTTFILWAIVEGMAVGTSRHTTSVLSVMGIALVLLYIRSTNFGARDRFDTILSVEVSGAMAAHRANLAKILGRHVLRFVLVNQQQISSERYLLNYRLLLRDPDRSHELREELASTETVEEVSMRRYVDESEI